MKVRHKTQRSDIDICYEVIDESAIHWIVLNSAGHGYRLALPKDDYEPVVEDRWVDVTGELQAAPYDRGAHINRDGKCFIACPIGYRFRKIHVCEIGNGAPTQRAFIIEKKA